MDPQMTFYVLAIVAFVAAAAFAALAIRTFVVEDIRGVRADLTGKTRQEGIERSREDAAKRRARKVRGLRDGASWEGSVRSGSSESKDAPERSILRNPMDPTSGKVVDSGPATEEVSEAAVPAFAAASAAGASGAGQYAPAIPDVPTSPVDLADGRRVFDDGEETTTHLELGDSNETDVLGRNGVIKGNDFQPQDADTQTDILNSDGDFNIVTKLLSIDKNRVI